MCEILKRSHLLFIFAILFGALIFITSNSYAASVEAEIPYAAKSAHYASRKGVVVVKWSKSYARLADGSISDVSGYQIQYSKSSSFSKAKSVYVGNTVQKRAITLRALKTKKKYRKNIKKYHFRVRSYIKTDGRKVYSRWCEATKSIVMIEYSSVTLGTLTAKKNTVTANWNKVKGKTGYIVFNMKSGANEWKKRSQIRNVNTLSFKDKGLAYYTTYKYAVIAYKKRTTSQPAKYSSSYFNAVKRADHGRTVTTGDYTMSKPTVRALLVGDSAIKVTWSTVAYADKYTIQYSGSSDFSDAQTIVVTEDDAVPEGAALLSCEIQNIDGQMSYYVRVMAAGAYKSHKCQSAFSAATLAESGSGMYTIEFDGNNATSGKMSSISVATGTETTLPANTFKRKGYKFDGWCYSENNMLFLDATLPMELGFPDFSNKETVRDLAGPNQTIRLYACWRADGPESAADWAVTIAGDDDFYYGTVVKNHCYFCQGGAKTFICNAFVAAAYSHGMRYFTTYRKGSTDYKWWLKNGFSKVGKKASLSKIKKGDVICCWNGKRWCHIMIAVTDGSDSNAMIAHAAGKGTGPRSIRLDSMKARLAKYKSYYVVRLKEWKSYDPTTGIK